MGDEMPLQGQRVGILAGWGRYPVVVAHALRDQGARVYGLGVKDHVGQDFIELCEEYQEIGIAKLGAAVRYYRKHNVSHATMAGKFHKTLLFKKFYWFKHLPDFLFLKTFYPHFIIQTKDRADDTILGTFVKAFGDHGVHFAPATDFAPELLVKHGILAGGRLSFGLTQDIEYGWKLASEMGRLDVGQSVAVMGRAVLAVEAVEGTDECIRRAGKLCPAGGFTIVKVAKPQQDMRFDVPTIGLGTLQTMHETGGRVLAIEADKTILLDRDEVVQYANRHKIRIVAIHQGVIGADLRTSEAA